MVPSGCGRRRHAKECRVDRRGRAGARDVDILATTVCRYLLCDHRFCGAGRPPDHRRLTGVDEKGEGRGELARAQRVVRGNGCGLGHGQDSGMAGRRREHPPGARPSLRSGALLLLLLLWGGGGCVGAPLGESGGHAASRGTRGTPVPAARQPIPMCPRGAGVGGRIVSRSCWRSSIQRRRARSGPRSVWRLGGALQ